MQKRANLGLCAAISAAAAMSASAATYETPYIASYSPASGAAGTVITVNGSGFNGLNGAWVGNGHDSTVMVVSDTVAKVTVPNDATTGQLALHNAANWSWSPSRFTVTSSTPTPTPPSSTSVTISGAVTGPTDASVKLSGSSSRVVTANSSGSYSFTGVPDGTYTLAPTTSGHIFTPSSLAAKVAGSSVSGANFTGVATSSPTYTLTGTVSGSTIAGVTVTLNGGNVGAAASDLSGNYSFSGLASGTYTVSASLAGHTLSQAKLVAISNVDSAGNNFTSEATPGGAVSVAAISPMGGANVGQAYSHTVVKSISGGNGTYHYQTGAMSTGTPPVGMLLNPNGNLTGTPTKAGTYTFEVCATDSAGHVTTTCSQTSIKVVNPSSTPPTPTPPTPTPPTPTPPTPASGTSWVYYNGAFDWPGDYSFVASANYSDTSGDPESGSKDIKVTLEGAWGGWLPYAQNWSFNSAPYTKLTFALKPTVSNQKWQVYFVKVGDVPVGIYLDVSKYGPTPVAGQWATYTVPLKDLGVLGSVIYKFCIQDQTGLSSNSWYVDNVGFAP